MITFNQYEENSDQFIVLPNWFRNFRNAKTIPKSLSQGHNSNDKMLRIYKKMINKTS